MPTYAHFENDIDLILFFKTAACTINRRAAEIACAATAIAFEIG